MSVTYLLAVSEHQAAAFLDQGYDLIAGFAVDAAAAADVTDVKDFIDLLNLGFPGSPFAPDKPIDIVHLPADPFVQARHAVGPLHPGAMAGGVIEFAPFDGQGVARGGGIETDLLLIDPARLTAGTRLWRFHPGNPEPELRGVYHGIAYGWENLETGTIKACVPTPFVGPVIQREWGPIPCDIEYVDGAIASVTLVSPQNPQKEDGFEQLDSGQWAKRVSYTADMRIFTQVFMGDIAGIPCRVVRTVNTPDNGLMLQVASMIPDAPYCSTANLQRWSTATFTTLAKPEHLLKQRRQEAVPVTWDMSERPAITATSPSVFDKSSADSLIKAAFSLMAQTAPTGWEKSFVRIQLVGSRAIYEAHALLPDNKMARMRVIPTAILHYMRQLKKVRAQAGETAFLTIVLQLEKNGKGTINVNHDQAPKWGDQMTQADWKQEMELYPRPADQVPDWLLDRLAGIPHTPADTSSTDLPEAADLTEGIERAADEN